MKKRSEETQTLRSGCSKAEPKIITPPQTRSRGAGQPNLISWRWSLPLAANPVSWGSMHAISSYRGNRPTNKRTRKQTGDYNTLRCSFVSAHCNQNGTQYSAYPDRGPTVTFNSFNPYPKSKSWLCSHNPSKLFTKFLLFNDARWDVTMTWDMACRNLTVILM